MTSIHDSTIGDAFARTGEFLTGNPMVRADADMRHVLDAQVELGAKSLEACLPAEARRQPTLEDAVRTVLERAGRESDDQGVDIDDIVITGPEGEISAKVYRSRMMDATATPPMILYIHDGGWIVGSPEKCDATPRALAKKTGAIVVSPAYRLAPEHKFPAAHDDCYAVWLWLIEEGASLGGDPGKAAVVGEGAGANIAINISLQAHAERVAMPVHQVLIHPIAGVDMSTPSYVENIRARPIGTPTMQWFFRHLLESRAETADPRLNLVERTDFKGLPPATLVIAEIDPLRSEGELLGEALHKQGVSVDVRFYEGVTQGFFGLGSVVNKAMFAQSHVANNLVEAFAASRRKI